MSDSVKFSPRKDIALISSSLVMNPLWSWSKTANAALRSFSASSSSSDFFLSSSIVSIKLESIESTIDVDLELGIETDEDDANDPDRLEVIVLFDVFLSDGATDDFLSEPTDDVADDENDFLSRDVLDDAEW